MTSRIYSQVGGFLLVTFGLWYLLRRTSLGAAYTSDMMSIPQGVSEGLRSAQTTFLT